MLENLIAIFFAGGQAVLDIHIEVPLAKEELALSHGADEVAIVISTLPQQFSISPQIVAGWAGGFSRRLWRSSLPLPARFAARWAAARASVSASSALLAGTTTGPLPRKWDPNKVSVY